MSFKYIANSGPITQSGVRSLTDPETFTRKLQEHEARMWAELPGYFAREEVYGSSLCEELQETHQLHVARGSRSELTARLESAHRIADEHAEGPLTNENGPWKSLAGLLNQLTYAQKRDQ